MKITSLTIGQSVKHPAYGVGTVKSLNEQTAEIRFNDETRTLDPVISELTPAEPSVAISGLSVPLPQFVEATLETVLNRLGYEKPEAVIGGLGARWHKGRLVMHPSDPTLQTKEVPLETIFHKIVMMRNNFRVLEQKINAHSQLSDAEKVEMQQYISKCYGSMTTFNILFKNEGDQFRSKA